MYSILKILLPLFFAYSSNIAQTLAPTGQHYRLKKVIEVEGRQGIAVDADYYYVSSSTALYKYDKEGNLLLKNEKPFEELEIPANHFGDIDVHDGKIYTGIEWFEDGVGKDIQIATYDAETLAYDASIRFDPESGQEEVSGITIDKVRNMAWMSNWVDGTYLYRYDLSTGKYAGKVHLRPVPQWQQGVFYADGKILISADDGDADLNETDNLYVADVADLGKTYAGVSHFRTMKEFKRQGEIEGLSMDPVNGDLLVLNNRGARIVLGMPKGFYEGYDREIHELYVYEWVE